MLKQISHIWKNNNGTVLAVCGFSAVIMMSVLWRFDLIPDIGQSLRVSPMLVGGRATSLPNIVVVSVTYEDMPDADVFTQVFTAVNGDNELLTPVESRSTTLRNGLSEFLLIGLARGVYAGLAYVDVNGNGQIDLAEDGSAAEPLGFARVNTQDAEHASAKGVFEVSGEPTFIKIHLSKPKFPVAP